MNIGEVIESSVWIDGGETPEQRKVFEKYISESINDFCKT